MPTHHNFNKYTIKALQYINDLPRGSSQLPMQHSTEPPITCVVHRQRILSTILNNNRWFSPEDFESHPREIGKVKATMDYLEWGGRLYHGPNGTYGNSKVYNKWKHILDNNN